LLPSITVTELLANLATYPRVVTEFTATPSGPSPTPSAVATTSCSSCPPTKTQKCSTYVMLMTETVSSTSLATYILLVLGFTATPRGKTPTSTVAITSFVPPSITETELPPLLTTYTRLVTGFTATPYGPLPTPTVFIFSLLLLPSITVTVLLAKLATYTRLVTG